MARNNCGKEITSGADWHILNYTKSAIESITDAPEGNSGKTEPGKIRFFSIA